MIRWTCVSDEAAPVVANSELEAVREIFDAHFDVGCIGMAQRVGNGLSRDEIGFVVSVWAQWTRLAFDGHAELRIRFDLQVTGHGRDCDRQMVGIEIPSTQTAYGVASFCDE